MSPKYNISSKSDMRRLQRDMNRQIQKSFSTAVRKASYTIDCGCGRRYVGHVGRNRCPRCGKVFEIRM